MKAAGTIGFVLFFFAVPLCRASREVTVSSLADFSGFRGSLAGVQGDTFRFIGEDGKEKSIPAAHLVEVRFTGAGNVEPAQKDAVVLEFVNGDRLKGLIISGGEEAVIFSPSYMKGMHIPFESLCSVVFPANADRFPSVLAWDPLQKQDTIYRVTEKGWDHVKGILTSIEAKKISIDTDLGAFTFDTAQVIAVGISQETPYKNPGGILCTARLVDGSALTGKIEKLSDESLDLQWLHGDSISIPLDKISVLGFKNTGYVFLSDLTPVTVEETPYLGGKEDFLFPYRKDRTCTGHVLSLEGRKYYKGLGVHSKCRLTYTLDKKYKRLSSLIGIDDEVATLPAKGEVLFRVFVDGEKKYESPPIRGLSPARLVSLEDLSNASALTLEVDFSDGSDAGDRANWVHALLVKK